jgi:MFS family permease
MIPDQQQILAGTTRDTGRSRRARDAISSAFQGFFVDMVDVYVAIIALTPAMIYFQPETLSPEVASTLASLTLVATLIGRPLGSLVFGSLADSRGRRGVTLISVAGFGILTLAIAALPGYATWGLLAPVALIVLRFLSGIFLGGEYSGVVPARAGVHDARPPGVRRRTHHRRVPRVPQFVGRRGA